MITGRTRTGTYPDMERRNSEQNLKNDTTDETTASKQIISCAGEKCFVPSTMHLVDLVQHLTIRSTCCAMAGPEASAAESMEYPARTQVHAAPGFP